MISSNYSKISGKKTQILVLSLIAAILTLTIYAIYISFRNRAVKTGSFYYEAPTTAPTPTLFIPPIVGD